MSLQPRFELLGGLWADELSQFCRWGSSDFLKAFVFSQEQRPPNRSDSRDIIERRGEAFFGPSQTMEGNSKAVGLIPYSLEEL